MDKHEEQFSAALRSSQRDLGDGHRAGAKRLFVKSNQHHHPVPQAMRLGRKGKEEDSSRC